MRVVFEGAAAVYHPASGLTLEPGVSEVADEQAEQLVALGIVREEAPVAAAPAEAPAAAPVENEATAPSAARARRGRE